jgi:glycosyltransferase EpsD
MREKVLFVANVRVHFLFHMPYMKYLKEKGYEVHACANGADFSGEEPLPACDLFFDLPIARKPFSAVNIKAYAELKRLIENGGYRLVSCHTPVGGVLARLAARKSRKRGTSVMYMAHGFYFYNGAPLVNWLLYYPIEKLCARMTDELVTINAEDCDRALRKLRARRTWRFRGVGIDVARFRDAKPDKAAMRAALGIPRDAILLISVGELSKRKNHEVIIKALAKIRADARRAAPDIRCLIIGSGPLRERLERLAATLSADDAVIFAGAKRDVENYYAISDILCFPSFMEGLPTVVCEAMAAGLPVLCSAIRGNADLIEQGKGGVLLRPDDADGFAEAICRLASDAALRAAMGAVNLRNIQKYDIGETLKEMDGIFSACLGWNGAVEFADDIVQTYGEYNTAADLIDIQSEQVLQKEMPLNRNESPANTL